MLWIYRQGSKDQTKKGPNIKLGPQGDKKGLGQDPRKDSSIDGGHHLKVMIYSWESFTADGFCTRLINECACQLEELMNTLERTRQELDSTKQRLLSTQQSLQERDTHLTNMRQERRKQLEEILEMKSVVFDFTIASPAFLRQLLMWWFLKFHLQKSCFEFLCLAR